MGPLAGRGGQLFAVRAAKEEQMMARQLEMLCAATLVLGMAGVSSAQQPVTWTAQPNISVRGNAIEKTRGCDGCDDASAMSREVIRSGNGAVEFRVDDPYKFWAAGLGRANAQPRFDAIDFAWRFNGNGWADVIEDGAYQSNSDTEATAGDVFQVAVVNGRVQYLRNGSIIHESSRRPSYPLAFAAALGTLGTRLTSARIDTSGRNIVGTSGRYNPSYNDSTYYDERAFDDLDRNRNGVITRAEFDGSYSEFSRIDLNRDGRLSRAEWARADSTSSNFDPRYDTGDYEAYVDARERWTDTGVGAEAGDVSTCAGDGTINLNQSGAVSAPSGSSYTAQAPPLPTGAVGLLIGRVGNSRIFPLGDRRSIRAPVSGQIYLGVNDDILGDNSGEYRVRISVRQR